MSVRKLQAQASGQQPDSSANNPNLVDEVRALRDALLQTQRQVAEQQREIEMLKTHSKAAPKRVADSRLSQPKAKQARLDPAPLHRLGIDSERHPAASAAKSRKGKSEEPPIGSFKFGDAVLTLGGFVDFENIFRTTNTQNNIATSFGTIPYNNTAQGRVTELRTTAQFSRLSVKVTDSFHGNDITGYVEGDFSGNDAPASIKA